MRLVMLGPPGSGKGTQARWLAKRLNCPHISTGAIFRDAIKNGTEMGKKARAFTEKGDLVPDDVVIGIVAERLKQSDCDEHGFILDGFPRTLEQGQALDKWLGEHSIGLDRVVELLVDDETLVKRLSGRRICAGCGKDFNVYFRQPKAEGKCDFCGGNLECRADDKPDAIRHRLEVDKAKTRPLHKFYEEKNLLVSVPGDGAIEEIIEMILEKMGRR